MTSPLMVDYSIDPCHCVSAPPWHISSMSCLSVCLSVRVAMCCCVAYHSSAENSMPFWRTTFSVAHGMLPCPCSFLFLRTNLSHIVSYFYFKQLFYFFRMIIISWIFRFSTIRSDTFLFQYLYREILDKVRAAKGQWTNFILHFISFLFYIIPFERKLGSKDCKL